MLLLFQNGISTTKISNILGVAQSTACTVIGLYNDIATKDFARAKSRAETNRAQKSLEWACNKHGYSVADLDQPAQQGPTTKPQETPSAPDMDAVIDAVLASDNKAELRMEKLFKKLDQLATIFQSLTQGVKDNMNANADIIHREQVKHTETLNGIKSNTRRTIWKGEAQ